MISPDQFSNLLASRGFNFFTGVPSAALEPFADYLVRNYRYVVATNEADAVSACIGAYLGGARSVAMFHHAGLSNAVSSLLSLTQIFKLPLLGLVGLQAEAGFGDEEIQEEMGRLTVPLLELMGVHWEYFADTPAEIGAQINRAEQELACGRSFFLFARKGTFSAPTVRGMARPLSREATKLLSESGRKGRVRRAPFDQLPTRAMALTSLIRVLEQRTVFLATRGFTSRELFQIHDSPNNFYLVGSSSCAGSIGLGLALMRPDIRVITLDDDSGLIVRMGSLATLARHNPANLIQIFFNNIARDSAGDDIVNNSALDLAGVAAVAGFSSAVHAANLPEMVEAIKKWKREPELTFVQLNIAQGNIVPNGQSPLPGAPNVVERLRDYLGSIPRGETLRRIERNEVPGAADEEIGTG
jgi:phosphonopyruvate decarboxylase